MTTSSQNSCITIFQTVGRFFSISKSEPCSFDRAQEVSLTFQQMIHPVLALVHFSGERKFEEGRPKIYTKIYIWAIVIYIRKLPINSLLWLELCGSNPTWWQTYRHISVKHSFIILWSLVYFYSTFYVKWFILGAQNLEEKIPSPYLLREKKRNDFFWKMGNTWNPHNRN